MFYCGKFITYSHKGVETIKRLKQIITHEILTS